MTEVVVPLAPHLSIDTTSGVSVSVDLGYGGIVVAKDAFDVLVETEMPGVSVGVPGLTGPPGSIWFVGTGPPGAIPDARPIDLYLDEDTGDIYRLVPPVTGSAYGSGPYGSGPYGGI